MCDQTETEYLDGDVVWVKLGSCWWPGEVVGPDKLPPDVLPSFRKPPIAVVKFFQETTYEYVKNVNSIYKYNCSKKKEFIQKGLYMYRTKHGHMEKFPEDVIRAETAVGGDIEILTRDEFQEKKKESYAGLFGDSAKKTPASGKRGRGRGRPTADSPSVSTPTRKFYKEKSDYKVHILVQPSKEPTTPQKDNTSEKDNASTPSTSRAGSVTDDKPKEPAVTIAPVSTPTATTSGTYSCPTCNFSTMRLNVLILHNKTHSVTYTPYTPSPARKKSPVKSVTKSSPKTSKTPKTPKPRKEKAEKAPKKTVGKKRAADNKPEIVAKKTKTDEEIKSSLLADWDDDADDESNDGSGVLITRSPELPVGAESPAAPVSAELPAPGDVSPEKKSDDEKPEASSSDSKYEFCEDEEWHEVADAGRKIPRVKNPKRKEENTKSLSLDSDDVAKEVAELLNKTAVPELPSVPEPLKIEENFPEPSIVKSPDKKVDNALEPSKSTDNANLEPVHKPTKAIFKTKTFFRSRHSRSQDAIGKYVAEQLNSDRLEMENNELNGSEVASSPEARDSPPIDHVKVARLAPKIQLKMMKAEAAQLERERNSRLDLDDAKRENNATETTCNDSDVALPTKPMLDVIYPTQEIKPINKEMPSKINFKHDYLNIDFEKAVKATCKMSEPEFLKERPRDVKNAENENSDLPQESVNVSPAKKSPSKPELATTLVNVSPAKKSPSKPEIGITSINVSPAKKSPSKPEMGTTLINVSPAKKSPSKPEMGTTLINVSPAKKSPSKPVMATTFANFSLEPEPEITPFKDSSEPDMFSRIMHRGKKYTRTKKSNIQAEIYNPIECSPQKTQDLPSEINPSPSSVQEPLQKLHSSSKDATPEKVTKNLSPKPTSLTKTTTSLQKTYEQLIQPYMSESTASAVDALLSVSRETDRVPRMVGSGPPEDLFEDDKDLSNNDEGINSVSADNGAHEDTEMQEEQQKPTESESDLQKSEHLVTDQQKPADAETNVLKPKDLTEGQKPEDIVVEKLESEDLVTDQQKPEDSETDLIKPEDLIIEPEKSEILKMNQLKPEKMIVITPQDLNGTANDESAQDNVNKTVDVPMECNDGEYNANQVIQDNNHPSESDLQIAETLLNLPSIQTKAHDHQDIISTAMSIDDQPFEETVANSENIVETDEKNYAIEETVSTNDPAPELIVTNNKNLNLRFETELEKNENLNAAQSLVQMSESIDHKMNVENNSINTNKTSVEENQNSSKEATTSIEQKIHLLSSENSSEPSNSINESPKFETTSSKLLKILEEPITGPKVHKTMKPPTPVKHVVVTGKEKILNFDVAKSALKPKGQTKQQIVIRRTGSTKSFLNNFSDVVASPDKIILSRTNVAGQDGSSVQTFTLTAPPEKSHTVTDPKQIIIQPKVRKLTKTPTKLQKVKPQNSVAQWPETKTSQTAVTDDAMFDINSMPVVLSDDLLTPESIEKMPIVMTDGNIINNAPTTQQNIKQTPHNPPKLIKTKPKHIENEKVAISASPSKSEVKTLLMNPVSEVKTNTPNILSKSAKLRGAKPMLVIDKNTGKQKIIMTKGDPTVKDIRQPPSLIQSAAQPAKTEKFIILPTGTSPRTGRTQKIVIDPQTGKAHVLVAKAPEPPPVENKPVSAKLIPQSSGTSSPGNTVMIITNAQGAQSRIVLTPEHEKILFPNKQQPNVSQLKTITQLLSTNQTSMAQKSIVTATSTAKTPTRIVPKQQKSAIITSKGQLIVGGRMTTTTQNIAPMPEIRPAPKTEVRTVPKRIIASEPKKLVQAIQKTTSEPLIFLQQKNGEVMQLTASQFEHLQRTGQIVHKAPTPPEKQIVVQKSITITPKEAAAMQKQRVRKTATHAPTPAKKLKQQHQLNQEKIAIAPTHSVPPLTSLSQTVPAAAPAIATIVPQASNTISVSTSSGYSDLDNFEELLPSTAIVKQQPEPKPAPAPAPEPVVEPPPPEPVAEPPPAQLSDGQLLAVPGENFGGPPGSFYLCVEDNGTLTPIDNRPLMLENNQLVPMAVEPLPVFSPQPERQDILQAALANSDVFHAESTQDAPDFRDLNANVSVHCRVSETSTTLNQPIMTPVEMPTEGDSKPTVPTNLEDGLAIIGVTPHTVPTTLELPITVTDPRIAPKTTDPLSNSNYGTTFTTPNADMPFVAAEESEVVGPISMPLLTDDDAVGKSMPILTDELTERTVSSIESTTGSPSSIDVPQESEEGGQWTRRLLTPGTDVSDMSEASVEIPLQPAIQLSVNDLNRHS
ncbi:hypothetical protein O0L34_g15461 [Tuta absoluta]|nr:hypothetical protein O0L34_g15461 [Tuta absoluta]